MTTPTLLLVPPIGHDAELYAPLRRELGDDVSVLAYDYPGFGDRVDPFDYVGPELLVRLADDVTAWVAERGVEPDYVGGVSLGGTLSFLVEERLGTAPRGLVLLASGGLPVASVRKDAVRGAMRELGDEGFARRHFGLDDVPGATTLRTHVARRTADVEAYFAHYVNVTWADDRARPRALAACGMLRAALEIDLREPMARPRESATVIVGDADRIFPTRYVDRLVTAVRGAVRHELGGVGHYPPLEAPREVAAILRAVVRTRGAS